MDDDAVFRALADASRRESIAQLVRQSGFVRNSELSSRFGVSTVTKAGAFGDRQTLLRCRGALKGVMNQP